MLVKESKFLLPVKDNSNTLCLHYIFHIFIIFYIHYLDCTSSLSAVGEAIEYEVWLEEVSQLGNGLVPEDDRGPRVIGVIGGCVSRGLF